MLTSRCGRAAIVLLMAALSIGPSGSAYIGLYEDTDLMEILDGTNFNDKVLHANTSYVIEFYNAFCGHCIRFSSTWKEFGIQINGWTNYVKVGVIDCANEINSQTCRDYEIMGYPTVRYFPPRLEPNNTGVEFLRSPDVQTMKDFLIEKLQETQKNENLSILCDIQPYDKVDVILNSKNILTFLIIDKPDDNKFAQELVIDYCPVKNVKFIFALNSNKGLVELLKTEKYPSLYLVENDNQFKILASGNNKTNFTNTINAYLETVHMTPFSLIDITTKLYNMLFKKNRDLMHNNTVYLSDLEATLRYSLDHEIISRSTITGDSLSALNGYLELLIEFFPSSIRGNKFIQLIWEKTRHNKTVSGDKLGNLINSFEFLLKPYITKRNWIGCEGSQPLYRKYPCGLWTMFHTLTVQASIKNLATFNGKQVLEIIADYVKHFFGCTDCSEHFMSMATTIQTNVSSLDDAVLWLWSAHNQVNQRLAGDVTEDPMHPKILFPLKVHCEACYQSGTNEWNKTEVLKYLKNMYSVISLQQTPNEISNSQPVSLLTSDKHFIDDNNNDINMFDKEEWKIDVSTCMVSYILSCSVLMILFYLLLVKKRCKKNKYMYFIFGKV